MVNNSIADEKGSTVVFVVTVSESIIISVAFVILWKPAKQFSQLNDKNYTTYCVLSLRICIALFSGKQAAYPSILPLISASPLLPLSLSFSPSPLFSPSPPLPSLLLFPYSSPSPLSSLPHPPLPVALSSQWMKADFLSLGKYCMLASF